MIRWRMLPVIELEPRGTDGDVAGNSFAGEIVTDAKRVRPSMDALVEIVASAIRTRGNLGLPLPMRCECSWCERQTDLVLAKAGRCDDPRCVECHGSDDDGR